MRSFSVTSLLFLIPAVAGAVARPAMAAPDPVAQTPLPSPIELREVAWGDRHGAFHHKQLPFQNGAIVEDPELYRILNRDDLVRAYRQRENERALLGAGALAAVVVGAIVFATNAPHTVCTSPSPAPWSPFTLPPPPQCETQTPTAGIVGGITAAVAAPILGLAAAAIDPNPISDAEKRSLIDQYNRSLAGAAPDNGTAALPSVRGGGLGIAPVASGNGGGLTVTGSF